MDHEKLLKAYLTADLPSVPAQKRLKYRTNIKEVRKLYRLLNKVLFDNQLPMPEFIIFNRMKSYWGLCEAIDYRPDPNSKKSNIVIHLSNKWYCKQWLVDTLAHEMCHQYQWDILGKQRVLEGKEPLLGHGPSFFMHRERFRKYGINLKQHIRSNKWFKYQDLLKC